MSEREILSPDQSVHENELICEKLLRWQPVRACRNRIKEWLDTPYGDDGAQWHTVVTPSFTTWAEAGLLLDALRARNDASLNGEFCLEHLTPDNIRMLALEYIRAVNP